MENQVIQNVGGLKFFLILCIAFAIITYLFFILTKKNALKKFNKTKFSKLSHDQQQRFLKYLIFLKRVNSEELVSNLERKSNFTSLHVGTDEEVLGLFTEIKKLASSKDKSLNKKITKYLDHHSLTNEDLDKIDEDTVVFSK